MMSVSVRIWRRPNSDVVELRLEINKRCLQFLLLGLVVASSSFQLFRRVADLTKYLALLWVTTRNNKY